MQNHLRSEREVGRKRGGGKETKLKAMRGHCIQQEEEAAEGERERWNDSARGGGLTDSERGKEPIDSARLRRRKEEEPVHTKHTRC